MSASHLSCAIALQAALESEQDTTRQLRESLAAMARESGEKSEEIRALKKQMAEERHGLLTEIEALRGY